MSMWIFELLFNFVPFLPIFGISLRLKREVQKFSYLYFTVVFSSVRWSYKPSFKKFLGANFELNDLIVNFGQSGGSPTGSLLKRTFASKANVPFSNGTSTSQRERSLHKGNVPFSNGTFASQRERSLFNWKVRFPKGPFASQRDRSLPKGNVRFSKGTFAFQRERSMLL